LLDLSKLAKNINANKTSKIKNFFARARASFAQDSVSEFALAA